MNKYCLLFQMTNLLESEKKEKKNCLHSPNAVKSTRYVCYYINRYKNIVPLNKKYGYVNA